MDDFAKRVGITGIIPWRLFEEGVNLSKEIGVPPAMNQFFCPCFFFWFFGVSPRFQIPANAVRFSVVKQRFNSDGEGDGFYTMGSTQSIFLCDWSWSVFFSNKWIMINIKDVLFH